MEFFVLVYYPAEECDETEELHQIKQLEDLPLVCGGGLSVHKLPILILWKGKEKE